jgi:hypothetical protein
MKIITIHSKKFGVKECFVDDEDFEYLNQWKWKLLVSYNSMYAVRNVSTYLGGGRKSRKCSYKCILMHRLIMGVSDPTILIDHIDQNGLNNQKINMRTCSKAENNRHVRSHNDSKYSKYLGVSFDKRRHKWTSSLTYKDKLINIGRFDSERDAALAYNKKAIELFGEFANPNNL